jgi:membrane protease YdiL (CAAX protease family)/Flp pilus assembly protein TadD
MLKSVGAVPLILRAGFFCLFSIAVLHGQGTNGISPTNLLQSAWSEFSSNHYVEAEQSFRSVILITPTNANAYAGLGRSLYSLKRYPEAITNLEFALALQPSHTNWLLFLGECYSSAGKSSKATGLFKRYVSLRTNDVEGYAWLTYSLGQEAKYDEAVSVARRALTFDPTNTYCYRQIGYDLEQLNRHDDAIHAFHQAIAINPKDGDAWWGCSQSFLALGRWDAATTNLEHACAFQKNNQAAHWLLFGCYMATMQPRKASQLFPWVFTICGCALMLAYLMSLIFLLPFSLRVHPKAFPGIWFSLAWLAVYIEGQIALFFVLGFLFQFEPTETVLTDVILAGIPVLTVGILGFRRQPWGRPFAWPVHLGTKKTIWLCLFGLVLVELFNWAYMDLVQWLTHHSPDQEALLLIKPALKANPLTTYLAIVILMPVVEEILFRGLFYCALERRLPTGGTIIVTSLVFAAFHLQMAFFIPLLSVGVLLGWARSKTGSIGLPILVHVLNNGLAFLLIKFTESSF